MWQDGCYCFGFGLVRGFGCLYCGVVFVYGCVYYVGLGGWWFVWGYCLGVGLE